MTFKMRSHIQSWLLTPSTSLSKCIWQPWVVQKFVGARGNYGTPSINKDLNNPQNSYPSGPGRWTFCSTRLVATMILTHGIIMTNNFSKGSLLIIYKLYFKSNAFLWLVVTQCNYLFDRNRWRGSELWLFVQLRSEVPQVGWHVRRGPKWWRGWQLPHSCVWVMVLRARGSRHAATLATVWPGLWRDASRLPLDCFCNIETHSPSVQYRWFCVISSYSGHPFSQPRL